MFKSEEEKERLIEVAVQALKALMGKDLKKDDS